MKFKILKIEELKLEIIHQETAIITQSPETISVVSGEVECEFKQNEMYLYRKTQDAVTEGLFDPLRETKLMISTEYGQTPFEVKTIIYEKQGLNINLKYELYSQSQLVDVFHFRFEIINGEDGVVGYA